MSNSSIERGGSVRYRDISVQLEKIHAQQYPTVGRSDGLNKSSSLLTREASTQNSDEENAKVNRPRTNAVLRGGTISPAQGKKMFERSGVHAASQRQLVSKTMGSKQDSLNAIDEKSKALAKAMDRLLGDVANSANKKEVNNAKNEYHNALKELAQAEGVPLNQVKKFEAKKLGEFVAQKIQSSNGDTNELSVVVSKITKKLSVNESEVYSVVSDLLAKDIDSREQKYKEDQATWRRDLPAKEADIKIRERRVEIENTKKQYVQSFIEGYRLSGHDSSSGTRLMEFLVKIDVYIPEMNRNSDPDIKACISKGLMDMMKSSNPELKEKGFRAFTEIVAYDEDLKLMNQGFDMTLSTYDEYMTKMRPLEELNENILELKKQRSRLEQEIASNPQNASFLRPQLDAINKKKEELDAKMGEMEGALFHESSVIQSIANMYGTFLDSKERFEPKQRSKIGAIIFKHAQDGSGMATNLLRVGESHWDNKNIASLLSSRKPA